MDGNPNEVCFLDCGSGGPEEFASRVDDAQYLYGLRKSVVQVCVCVCDSVYGSCLCKSVSVSM